MTVIVKSCQVDMGNVTLELNILKIRPGFTPSSLCERVAAAVDRELNPPAVAAAPEPKIPDGFAMTARGHSYAEFRKAGWTDTQLKNFGYLEPTPPLWRAWHCPDTRLAPLGVTVEIRDKSGKRIGQWMFGTGHHPAFLVKSWRFMTEQDAIADDKRRAATVFKRSFAEVLAGLKVTPPTPLPAGAVVRGGVAFGNVTLGTPRSFMGGLKPDPMRWRVTGIPGAELPKGIPIEAIVAPLPDSKVRWRFKYRIDAEAYDNVRATKR